VLPVGKAGSLVLSGWHRTREASQPLVPILHNFILLACGSVVALMVAEGVLRAYNPIRSTTRANDIVLPAFETFRFERPNTTKASRRGQISYNSLGFRGPEPPRDFDVRTTIVTVGGSTTACDGITDGKTWPDHLRNLLQASHEDVWLNNAGFSGHSSFGHIVLLKKDLVQLGPDYVLLLVGVNDVDREDLNDWDRKLDPSQHLDDRLAERSELLATLQSLYRMYHAFKLGLLTFSKSDLDLSTTETFPGPVSAPEALREGQAPMLRAYRDRLRTIFRLCREAGITPVWITQPALYGTGIDPTTGIQLDRLTVRASGRPGRRWPGARSSAEQWQVLEMYNQVMRDVAAETAEPLIDLAVQLPKDSRYYYDWIHYSEEGTPYVARIVAEGMEGILRRAQHEPWRSETLQLPAHPG
jgi:lysophospholipase L1-like esterase